MCVFVCMHVHMYVYLYVLYVCLYICMSVNVCLYVCEYECVHVCVCVCTGVKVCVSVCVLTQGTGFQRCLSFRNQLHLSRPLPRCLWGRRMGAGLETDTRCHPHPFIQATFFTAPDGFLSIQRHGFNLISSGSQGKLVPLEDPIAMSWGPRTW